MRFARVLSILNLHSWSDYALHLVNSAAHIIALVAAALVLISLAFIYFTGTELTERAKEQTQAPGEGPGEATTPAQSEKELAAARRAETTKTLRLAQLEVELAKVRKLEKTQTSRLAEIETELAAARRSDEAKASRLSKTEAELAAARKSEEQKTLRLTQTAAELAAAQRAEEARASRLAQVEPELAEARRSEEAKALRLAEVEAELAALRRSVEEAKTVAKQMEAEIGQLRHSAEEAKAVAKELEIKQGPRKITPEQRSRFLNAVRGQPTGKVIVSAFFDNKETHDFGAGILNLVKEANFTVVERAPINFFTTSRPSSGVRIGCENISNPPVHFSTLQKGLGAIGLETPTTSLINSQEDDVVEIQVTPRQ